LEDELAGSNVDGTDEEHGVDVVVGGGLERVGRVGGITLLHRRVRGSR
jgi:hypothetical protein